MSATDVCKWVVVTVTYLCAVFILNTEVNNMHNKLVKLDIARIAKMDLSLVGRYDSRLTVSVKYWVYAIEVAVYHRDKSINLIDTLRNWNNNYNEDDLGIILKGIEDAHTLFLGAINEAMQNKIEPTFKVSPCYDYHDYPLSFKYNDYINPNELINVIDSMQEVQ